MAEHTAREVESRQPARALRVETGTVAREGPRRAAALLTLQRMAGNRAVGSLVARNEALAPPNRTGLPDGLKAGVESLSGISLDGVRVHYDSSGPASVDARAYTKGSDVHVAQGQERHLPHEAWHVVQQAQGRVQPTAQLKDGVAINDDEGLEREADTMGARAAELGRRKPGDLRAAPAAAAEGGTVQLVGLNSAKITLEATGANVNKAPDDFSARRYGQRTTSIDGIDKAEISGASGSIIGEDVSGGVRVDVQGDFHEGDRTFYNVQAQANDPVRDLHYPGHANAQQRGTSLGEVHVEDRLAESARPDILNRMARLVKSGLYQSIGAKASHPRPVYKITHPKD